MSKGLRIDALDLSSVDIFDEYCRMTRYGGSDDDPGSKQCACKGPRGCQVKHLEGYDKARERAKGRMMGYLKRCLEKEK